MIVLTVTDDGCGFNTDGPPAGMPQTPGRSSQRNGLVNMKRRLAEIHGGYDIQSAPGRGTTVKFTVAVKA